MKVIYFTRRQKRGNFSVERIFTLVRKYLPRDLKGEIFVSSYESKGIWPRLYNIFEARSHQGDVNHITGDVHFLSYLLNKRKTVLTILDCGFNKSKKSLLRKTIIKWLWFTLPARRVSYITTISEFSKKEILSTIKFDPGKIVVIPVPLMDGFSYAKKKFNLKKPAILQIGTAPNKNLFRLFEALEGINCRLVVVGNLTKAHLKSLKVHKIDYKNLTNLSDKQIIKRYQKCDLVTFVSTYEGFGMPIVEANATGRPVITSDLPPMREVASGAACLVNPYSTSSIRQGILKVIKDESYRKNLIVLGQKNAKRFRPKPIVAQYVEVYNKVAQKL